MFYSLRHSFFFDQVKLKLLFIFPFAATLVFVIQFFKIINLSYAPVWKDESVPFSFYEYLLSEQIKTGRVATVSAHGLHGKMLNYYDYLNGTKINTVEEKDFPSTVADFIVANKWNNKDLSSEYDTILYSKQTNIALLRRKHFIKWEQILIQNRERTKNSDYFIPILEIPANQFINNPFSYDITYNAQSDRFPFICRLVTELRDSSGEVISYNTIDLQRVKSDLRSKSLISRKQFLDPIPESAKIIRIYFWNLKERHVDISDLKIILFKGTDT